MDLSKFFETLAQYLNFFFDFVLVGGLDKYARIGSVSPELVSYFIVGLFVAYVVSSVKHVPGYERMITTEDTAPSGKVESAALKITLSTDTDSKTDMAAFILLSIAGGIICHLFILIHHKVFPNTEIGNIKDTLNAVFAVNAVYNPLNALLKQVQRGAKIMGKISRGWGLVGAAILLITSGIYFGTTYYWLYAFAGMHGTSRKYMLGPMGFFVVLGLILGIFLVIAKSRSSSDAVQAVDPGAPPPTPL